MENKSFSKYSKKQIGLIIRILTEILKNNSYDCHECQGLNIFWDNLSYKISDFCKNLYVCICMHVFISPSWKRMEALETTLWNIQLKE